MGALKPAVFAEIRPSPRAGGRAEVDGGPPNYIHGGFADGLSEDGLFVASGKLYEVGTRLTVYLSLPGFGERLATVCEVSWVRLTAWSPDAPAGLGLRFCALSDAAAHAIQQFVGHRKVA